MKYVYRIYVLLCVGVGLYVQHGKPHPDYALGAFQGVAGSWFVPGILLELLLRHHDNLVDILGGSLAFWLVVGLWRKAARAKASRAKASGRPLNPGLVVDASPYAVLPDLPAGFSYYGKPTTHTTRTVRYIEE